MEFLKQYRFRIAIAIVLILGAGLLYIIFGHGPLPDMTTFKTKYFSFEYPRTYAAQEYSSGVVSLGTKNGEVVVPAVEVNRYQNDPDEKTPASFDAFMKRQAGALCGADGPVESITCTQVGVTAYTSPKGLSGAKLDLTLVRKNLKTGTTTSSTYGPLYVFNTTPIPTPDAPLRYTAIFVYPALSAFLEGTTTPALMQEVLDTLIIPSGVSTVK